MASAKQHLFWLFDTSLRAALISLAVTTAFLLAVVAIPPAQAQTFTVIHNFTNGPDGGLPANGVTIDASGNLYGTTQTGPSNAGTIFKLSYKGSGWILTPLYNFGGGSDGSDPQRLTIGANGSLYEPTLLGGSYSCNCGGVFNLRPSPTRPRNIFDPWTETALYSFQGGTDGSRANGDVISDSRANIYGTTIYGGNGYGTVYEITHSTGGWTESVLHRFTGQPDGANPFSGVIFDNAGNLYGTTSGGGNCFFDCGTIYELMPSGSGWTEKIIYNFQGGSDGYNPVGGLVFDQFGSLYGTTRAGGSGNGGTVFRLTPSGDSWTLTTIYSFTGSFGGPMGSLVMDALGNLYGSTTSDGANGFGSVFKLTRSGEFWTYASLHDFTGGNDGHNPYGGPALDATGNLYGTTYYGGTNGYGVVWEITP